MAIGWMHTSITRIWYSRHEGWGRKLILFPFFLLSLLYRVIVVRKRAVYSRPKRVRRVSQAQVISIGNLVAGGAGKTPVAIHIAQRLQAMGRKPALLSRGWGRQNPKQTIIVSNGERILQSVEKAGDEPTLIARSCPGLPVLVGPDRVELARLAVAEFGANVLVLDDGFQHLRLHRDLDIVVLDAANPFGNGHLIPRGPLREPISALARAGMIWLTKVDQSSPQQVETLANYLCSLTGRMPIRSTYEVVELIDEKGNALPASALAGRRVMMMAGLGRPQSFAQTLQSLGAKVVAQKLLPDHGWISHQELESAEHNKNRQGWDLIAFSEKDAVRLPEGRSIKVPSIVVRIEVKILCGEEYISQIL